MNKAFLGEFEQMVMLAILRLGDGAHGTAVSAELEDRAGRRVSRSALYSSLDRLEKKGHVRWEVAPATSERGGHPKRRFEVTESGLEALRHCHAAWVNLTAGLDGVLRGRPS